jgi:hypothetical protein
VRARAAGILASLALFAALPAASTHAQPVAPVAIAAKTCRVGYVHARIGGHQKCLHAGQYCARRYQRQYRRYHFTCNRRDRYGRWHLRRLR